MYAPRRYSELEAQGAEDIYNPHHLEYWLRQRGLGRFADRLHDFGVDTLHDLHDSDIISDVELRSEIGMNDSEIRKFRKACQTNRSVDWSHLNKKATEAVRRKTQVMQAEKHEGYVSSSKKACKFSIILAISASIALLCGQCDAHRLSSPHDDDPQTNFHICDLSYLPNNFHSTNQGRVRIVRQEDEALHALQADRQGR